MLCVVHSLLLVEGALEEVFVEADEDEVDVVFEVVSLTITSASFSGCDVSDGSTDFSFSNTSGESFSDSTIFNFLSF